MAETQPGEGPDGGLRVLTWDLWWRFGDRAGLRCRPRAEAHRAARGHAEPDSDELRLLGGHLTAPAVAGLVLVDAWRYADPADAGRTWDGRNPHVAATHEPSARIDHVLAGLPGPDGRGRVLDARLVGDRPVAGTWPSDHCGSSPSWVAEPAHRPPAVERDGTLTRRGGPVWRGAQQ